MLTVWMKIFKKVLLKIKIITTQELLKKYKPRDFTMHIAISYKRLNHLRSEKYQFFKKKDIHLITLYTIQIFKK